LKKKHEKYINKHLHNMLTIYWRSIEPNSDEFPNNSQGAGSLPKKISWCHAFNRSLLKSISKVTGINEEGREQCESAE